MSQQPDAPAPQRRSVAEQLHRSPRVVHASWMTGLAVLLSGLAASGGEGWSVSGLVFLAVLFLPIVVAYRRDRLSFRIVFATFFLPTWPWAAYKAFSRGSRTAPLPAR